MVNEAVPLLSTDEVWSCQEEDSNEESLMLVCLAPSLFGSAGRGPFPRIIPSRRCAPTRNGPSQPIQMPLLRTLAVMHLPSKISRATRLIAEKPNAYALSRHDHALSHLGRYRPVLLTR